MTKHEWKLVLTVGGLFLFGIALAIGAMYLQAYIFASVAKDMFQ